MNGRVQKTFQFARVHIFYAWCIHVSVSFCCSHSYARPSLSFAMRFDRRCSHSVQLADFDFISFAIMLCFDIVRSASFFISFAFSIVVSLIRQEWEREIVFKQSKTWSNTRCVATKRNHVRWMEKRAELLKCVSHCLRPLSPSVSHSPGDRLHGNQTDLKRDFLINDRLRIKSIVKRTSWNWITYFHQFFSFIRPKCGVAHVGPHILITIDARLYLVFILCLPNAFFHRKIIYHWFIFLCVSFHSIHYD